MNDLGRLLRYVLPWWRKLVAALLCAFFFAIFSGVTIGMILPFTKILFDGNIEVSETKTVESDDLSFIPQVSEWKNRGRDAFLGLFVGATPRMALFRICIGIFVIFFMKGMFNYLQQILMITLQERVIKKIRDDLYFNLTCLPVSFFEKNRTGELISRITNDVTLVKDMVSVIFTEAIQNVMLLTVYFSVAVLISWRLALLSSIIFPLLGIFTGKVSKKLRKYSTHFQEDMARITSNLEETITGIRIVKAFGTERYESSRFGGHTGRYLDSFIRFRRFGVLASPVAEQLGVVGAVIVLWYGGNQVLSGSSLGPEGFFLFLAAVLNLMQPIRKLSHVNTMTQQGLSAARRIFYLLDTTQEARPERGKVVDGVKESIHFDGVTFRYDTGKDAIALRNVSFHIPSGTMVALVGPSGAGKSTLADIVVRFHDPTEGAVLLDGIDTREIDLDSLRGITGMVTQDVILFNDTVRNNIAYGRNDIPLDQVKRAAAAANADSFIRKLSEGYDTVVGDRGLRLSGGERQRIAIARAILKNPALLILDEATSSLDAESEALVQKAIENLVKDRTTLVIAHRLSTILRADRIVVLDRGAIVQQGTHRELLLMSGLYRKLFEMQFRSAPGEEAG